MISAVTAACIMVASNAYSISPVIIAGIMATEGGKVGRYSTNTNGTKDLGPMQINDRVWIPSIADTFFAGDRRRAEYALLNDGCFNVEAGAWILRKNIDLSDGDIMEGIGKYHSWTPKHKEKYKLLFMKNYRRIMKK